MHNKLRWASKNAIGTERPERCVVSEFKNDTR